MRMKLQPRQFQVALVSEASTVLHVFLAPDSLCKPSSQPHQTAAWSQKYGVDAFTKAVTVTLNGCVCISAVYSLLSHLFNVLLSFLRIKACRGQHTPVCT